MNLFTRRSWAVIVFTALLIVIVNLSWWLFYLKTEENFENQLSRRLGSIAALGASGFSPEIVSGLVGSYLWAYDKTLDLLENIRAADSLSEVFVLDDNYNYLATTSIDSDSVYYLAALNGGAIEAAFMNPGGRNIGNAGYSPAITAGYRSGDLILKSAFAPLEDTNGVVSAVLGVEADVDYADDLLSLRQSLYISTGISVGIGLIFGMVFFVVQKRFGAAERSIFMAQSQTNLGRMVAVVSHEIKNPLMIIRASAESLKKKHDTPEADFILEEIDRLNHIVTGYLDFASGKLILRRDSVDVRHLILNIIEKFTPRFKERGVQILSTIPNEKFLVISDPTALRQVIINLVLNAADAVSDVDGGTIHIRLSKFKNKMRIGIADNGPGIGSKELKNIFEPFFTTKVSGSGLGLFHSRRLIEEMGGKIEAKSEIGGPTNFTLILPVADTGE